ncbi:MAG: orotidine-5'-phosphate decarboxylase [Acidobacteria bacterium]|nr:MAG: orotidine-5'-phosphate decarboxylase [Acidobacteriota bacterium]PIE89713.1 MAG: orotidine-5'-phosphate decarboxylase [Acidobacteriota bacterium]
MKSFACQLHERIKEKNTRLLVGLDPHPGKIPVSFASNYREEDVENLLFDYFSNVVDKSRAFAAAFKPQIAFFEAYGMAGMRAFTRLLAYLRSKGEIIVVDGKRNDIGSTAAAYARAYFKAGSDFNCHALTVNAYLGSDGIEPFLSYPQKGIFALLKTSNPSSGQIQDLYLRSGDPLYHHMSKLFTKWNEPLLDEEGFGPVGAVIGATYPEHMQRLRKLMPHSLFLVPGYGAQGGSREAVRAAFMPGGKGAIINSSRMINFPAGFESKGFEAVAEAAEKACKDINSLAL